MVQETLSRTSALSLAAIIILLYVLFDVEPSEVGIWQGVTLCNRFTYPFFHASFLHAFMNIWCLLSVVFMYPLSLWSLLISFAIAISFPIDTLYSILPLYSLTIPSVGLSGVCFALMGRLSFMVRRKWYYQSWLAFYILLGFIFPNTNGWLHLYCYLMGVFVAFLNKPLRC